MQRQKKIYIVQASLDLQFAVVASDDDEAKKEARKLVQKALDTGVLGSVGWTLEFKNIHEAKPISR
jgi:predicted dinucleotide-binding enzyme